MKERFKKSDRSLKIARNLLLAITVLVCAVFIVLGLVKLIGSAVKSDEKYLEDLEKGKGLTLEIALSTMGDDDLVETLKKADIRQGLIYCLAVPAVTIVVYLFGMACIWVAYDIKMIRNSLYKTKESPALKALGNALNIQMVATALAQNEDAEEDEEDDEDDEE